MTDTVYIINRNFRFKKTAFSRLKNDFQYACEMLVRIVSMVKQKIKKLHRFEKLLIYSTYFLTREKLTLPSFSIERDLRILVSKDDSSSSHVDLIVDNASRNLNLLK